MLVAAPAERGVRILGIITIFQYIQGRTILMIKKVVSIKNLNDKNLISDVLKYWLNKSPEERVATVEYLRRQYHGSSERLQRVVRVIQRV
jgi:hypothetical protein